MPKTATPPEPGPAALPAAAWPLGLLLAAGTVLLSFVTISGVRAEAPSLATPPTPQLPARPAARNAQPGVAPASDPAGQLVTIESDRQQADNRTGIVTATGNVRIVYPERSMVATARQAQYFSREGRLVLSGDVEVVDKDGQRIRAERLTYLLGSERLQAEPASGRQVQSKIRLQAPASSVAPLALP